MINPSIPNYTLLEKIGEGGFGLVYKAKQSNTGQLVAVKVLKNDTGIDEQKRKHQQARFERETQLSARINHPHIVKLLDKGHTEKGELFAVFEYVAGETLKDYIIRNGALSASETGVLMGQALDALVCAHEQGIVHRDLKPQNLMVSQTGSQRHIKILDFGIGAFTHEYRTKDYKSLTLTKEMVGTPSYSAPEQLRGEPPTVKSDLYAWGLILIECLTGKTVMEGDSIAEIFQQQLQAQNVPLPAAILDHPLASLLRRVLEKNPQNRAGEAATLYEDYIDINFNSIVGKLARQSAEQVDDYDDDPTLDSDMDVVVGQSAKRQITVLCLKLSLVLPDDSDLSPELLDTIQKDQLNGCQDIAIRYGGHIAGSLGDTICIYYGYPDVSDDDARRAGRAALELVTQTQKRSALLDALHGISLDIRVSLHVGSVVIKQSQLPEGLTQNIALNLLHKTKEQSVLVSDITKKLLDPFLEFEVAEPCNFSNVPGELQVYSLVGERQTEALSFLRPQSAGRQMIGRESEREIFTQQWQQVQADKGQALLLSGQAGIGKSRLTYECKKQLRDEGIVVAECRCLPEHENNALYPFFDMLRKHWGLQEGENQDFNIARLESVLNDANCDTEVALPILCSWLSVPLSNTYEAVQLPAPEQQKEILLNTLEQLILNLGETQQFLLIVEDLHWLDPTSKEFLERLLVKIKQQEYLLLMTTRPHFSPDWSFARLTTVNLEPLGKSSAKDMIEGVLGGRQVADQTVEYISERADGVPLFIEELSQMLLEQGYLILSGDTYKLQENLNEEAVPVTLQALLNARLDKLGLAKETAQLAAAMGRNFDYDLLVKSSLRGEAMVQADLHQLMNADLIYRQRRVQGESYIFRHALIRDAAYDGMPDALQKDTHQRIAFTLEGDFPQIKDENPFEVARHFAGAELFANAADYGVQMVKKQVDGSANQEALLVNEVIQKWVDKINQTPVKLEYKLSLNSLILSAYMALDGYGSKRVSETRKEMDELIKVSESLDISFGDDKTQKINTELSNSRGLMDIFREKSQTFAQDIHQADMNYFEKELSNPKFKNEWVKFLEFHLTSQRQKAIQMAAKALEAANALQLVAILPMISQALFSDGKLQESVEIGTTELELLTQLEHLLGKEKFAELMKKVAGEYGMEPRSGAYFLLSQTYCYLGFPNKGNQLIEKSINWGEAIDHTISVTLSYIFKVFLHYILHEKEKVKETVEKHDEKYGHITENNWVTTHLKCHYDWGIGSVDYAQQYVDDTLASGQHYALAAYEVSVAETYIDQKNAAKAIELMEASQKRCRANEEYGNLPLAERWLALSYYAVDGELTERVERHLVASIEVAQKTGAKWLNFEANIDYVKLLQKHQSEAKQAKLSAYSNALGILVDFFVKNEEATDTQQLKDALQLIEATKGIKV